MGLICLLFHRFLHALFSFFPDAHNRQRIFQELHEWFTQQIFVLHSHFFGDQEYKFVNALLELILPCFDIESKNVFPRL